MSPLDVLRLVVGVPVVLLLPGWLWSWVAFPQRGRLDGWERGGLSLAASLALVSLGALAWDFAGLPFSTWGSISLVAVLCLVGGGLAYWRRRTAASPVN